MKAHTNGFKNNIKEFGRELDSKIRYELNGETIELSGEQLNSITPHYKSALLKSTMKQLDIDSNVEIPEGTIINYQLGVKVGNSYEYLNYGNYIVYSIEKQEDKYSYLIKCYDKMLYSMKDYESMEITYPITVRNFINAICNKVGLTFKNANEQFVNYNKEIPKELYLSTNGTSIGYTFRDVLDELAEATASNICINEEDDKLEIRYIKDAGSKTEATGSDIEITDGEEAELSSFELEGKTTQANTPTPDYPSELVSVGFRNLLKNTNTNSGDNNYWWQYSTYDEATRTLTRSTTATRESFITHRVNGFKSGKTYTLTLYAKSNGYVKSMDLYALNASSQGGVSLKNITLTTEFKKYTFTFTTASDVTYGANSMIRIDNNGSTTSGTEAILTVKDVCLVEGSIPCDYIDYGKYGIEIKTTGKNLFNISAETANYQYDANGNYNNNTSYNISDFIKTNNNITVSFEAPSGSYAKFFIVEFDNGYNFITRQTNSNVNERSFTFALNQNTKYIRFQYRNDINMTNIQLEKGTQATPYEEYKENTYLYTLNQPLRSIGDTKDLLYIKNGMLYVERKIKSVTYTGNENGFYVQRNTSPYIYGISVIDYLRVEQKTSLCNHFPTIVNGTAGTMIDNQVRFRYYNDNDKSLYFCSSQFTTLDEFKVWLSTHNTEVQYILDEPFIEELGQVDMPSTYESITYIETTDSNEPTMNISYIDEFEEIDEEYLKDVNVNFGKKFGPVNTVILSRSGGSDKTAQSIPEDLADEDKVAIEISENQIMNDKDRADYIPEILNKLKDTEYYLNDFTSTGICYLNLLDRYRIKVFENKYKSVMLNDEANITQGLEESIYTEKPEETETEYKYTSSDDRKVNQTYIIAKKNEGTIEAVVEAVSGKEGLEKRIQRVETKQTATDLRVNVIGTHIDQTTGDVREVKTSTGFTFNAEGMTIEDSASNFKALHRNTGTYYYDGNVITGQYTKDGSKQKDLELFGVYYYGKNDINETPRFVTQLFTDNNGVEGVGHFYNGGD